MHMPRINPFLISLYLILILQWGCNNHHQASEDSYKQEESVSIPQEQTSEDAQVEEEELIREVESVILSYYNDLSAENPDIATYYAPTVKKYYSQANISREKVGDIIMNTYNGISNRNIILDRSSIDLQVSEEEYIVEFEGAVSLVRDKGNTPVNEKFRNRVVFNKDFQITHYESLEVNPSTSSRLARPSARAGAAIESLLSHISGDASKGLTSIINPEVGFFFITRPGALDAVYHLFSAEEIVSEANTPWIIDELSGVSCQIALEDLPSYNCDNFSKKGCFLSQVNDPDRISKLMEALEQANITSFSSTQQKRAVDTEQLITYELVITEKYLSMLFGQVEGKWYLLLLDAAKYDCSA